MTTSRRVDFWSVLVPGWLLFAYLTYAQGIPAVDYELGVRMGTQEPAGVVTEVGAAFWYGFALGDLVIYIPLLAVGLFGFARQFSWGRPLLAAALGITLYWPVVCLTAAAGARGAPGWQPDETGWWVVLPAIFFWGLWGLWRVAAARPD
jgi:hypothetical protein